ncbi:hypothetical protein [Thermospira aquatica]|uniref:Uncharacterized protein n=1 Tax=Thermospira aquatica TaxID=2828656 RepID=A0AAX3BG35_9SPIR|nr:hypothetical protein [Thermospira aquatica]URA11235.1 hypothetical protein KDW03_05415 [Thermospira aquatica]
MQMEAYYTTSGLSRITTVVVVVLVMILGVWPFIRNYKYADHHLDYLNHDYGKNLMASSEPGSVYMTEGGDNQVFSSLYFVYAARVRPDLSPYDQMGNVFKKIYGLMLYSDPRVLARRKDLVDSNIFAGLEPFYVQISNINDPRINLDPYFIPYWQGQRPVYLTWQRPEVWKLGDYTYRRYGIMYKVEPIAHRLLDDLEIRGSLTVGEAQYLFSEWLKRSVDRDFVLEKVRYLASHGYVKQEGEKIVFIKNTPFPLADYFSRYRLRWGKIPNLAYLDRMTREIAIGYDMQMGNIYRSKIRDLQTMYQREVRSEVREKIAKEITNAWEQAKAVYREAISYGHDSVSIIGALVALVENEVGEDLSEEAWPHFRRLLSYYYKSRTLVGVAMTYNQLLLRTIYRHPDRKEKLLPLLEENIRHLRQMLVLRSEVKLKEAPPKDIGGGFMNPAYQSYQEYLQWKQYVDMLDVVTKDLRSPLSSRFEETVYALLQNPKVFSLDQKQMILVQLIQRTQLANYVPYANLAGKIIDVLSREDDLQTLLFVWQMAIQVPDWTDKAFVTGDKILRHKDFQVQPLPEVPYNLGILAYQIAKTSNDEGDVNKSSFYTMKSKEYMKVFKLLCEGNLQLQARFAQQLRVADQVLALP